MLVRRAILVVVLAVAAGCGFLPADDFTGKRAGDGIAPWDDLGPAQLCLGNQFLGAPGSTPGGLCFDGNVSEAPCTGDRDCRSREACVCGRCIVAYCSTASDCGGGRTCTFSQNRCDVRCFGEADCDGPEECFNGTCRGRCIVDAECQTGEICNAQNFCATASCANDGGCLDGERCRVQRVPRQVLEPTAAIERVPGGTLIVLWLEIADAVQLTETAIWRATSADGLHFTMNPASPVLVDGTSARAPSVVRVGAGYAMFYEWNLGAEIRVATSVDGITWNAPRRAIAGGVDAAAARAPSAVVLPDGSVAVYYQIGDGAAISLATGAVGDELTLRGPVLLPRDVTVRPGARDAPYWDDVERVRSPHAAITQGAGGPSLRLWFSAFGRESGDSFQFGEIVAIPPNYSIGYAAASIDEPTALLPWPYGPVVDRVSAFLSHHEELSPAVVQLPGERDDADDAYLMYYVDAERGMGATGPDGPFVIGRLGVLGNGAHARTTEN